MTLKSKALKVGDIDLLIYDFEYPDDILPAHSHTAEDNHITIVSRGKLVARYGDQEKIISSGDIYDWKENELHEFRSIESNSRIINIRKKYRKLDKSDFL